MVQAKIELFNDELIEQANFFKALAHPARLQILQFLVHSKTCITSDISDDLPLSRTTVNQHLKELKAIGLIQGSVHGKVTNYCLNPTTIEILKKQVVMFLNTLKAEQIDCKVSFSENK